MPGLRDYQLGQQLAAADLPFYVLLQAAMRKADTSNFALLADAFPAEAAELRARYDAPGGRLPADPETRPTR